MRRKPIDIGSFNQTIELYTISQGARYGFGSPTVSESTPVTQWANVKNVSKTYVDENGGIEYPIEYEVMLRAEISVSVGDKITYNGNNLTAINITNDNKTFLVIKCASNA